MLAHHFSHAEDWERALDYLLQGRREGDAGLRPAPGASISTERRWRRPRGSAIACPRPRSMAIHRARADLFFGVGDFGASREAAEALVALARRAGDRVRGGQRAGRSSPRRSQWAEDFPAALRARAQRRSRSAESARGPAARWPAACTSAATCTRSAAASTRRRMTWGARWPSGGRSRDPARQALALHILAMHSGWQGDYRGAWSWRARGPARARASPGRPAPALPLERRERRLNDAGEYDAGARRPHAKAWPSPRRSATTPSSLASSTRSAGCASSAVISRRGIELSEQSYEATGRSSRAGHGTGAERRAFIRNNEADAWMARGTSPSAADALAESQPHRPASSAVPLDDLALRDALSTRAWASSRCCRAIPNARGGSPTRASS